MKTGAGERAFSMVELLVAISLSAVLVGIATLRLPAFYGQYQLTSAAHQVAADLVRVRAKAIGASNQYKVVFAERSYQVKVNSAGSFVNDGSATALPSGARIPTVPDALTFNPIGMLPTTSTITVTTVAGSKQVSINELGRVQVQ
jgi:prepilin-type N-terminal cleavage/methylation domain-containing protein